MLNDLRKKVSSLARLHIYEDYVIDALREYLKFFNSEEESFYKEVLDSKTDHYLNYMETCRKKGLISDEEENVLYNYYLVRRRAVDVDEKT